MFDCRTFEVHNVKYLKENTSNINQFLVRKDISNHITIMYVLKIASASSIAIEMNVL